MRSRLSEIICLFVVVLVFCGNVCQGSEQCSFASTAANPKHCYAVGNTVYVKVGIDLIFPPQFKVILEDGVGVLQYKKNAINILEVKKIGQTEIKLTTEYDKVGQIFKVESFD